MNRARFDRDSAFEPHQLEFLQAFTRGEVSRDQWRNWLRENGAQLQLRLERRDWLRLKCRPHREAHDILALHGLAAGVGPAFCDKCGETVINVVPGQTTREQIRVFAQASERAGFFAVEENDWVHPGRYCPNGCTYVLIEYRPVSE